MLVWFFTCLIGDSEANPLLRTFALANCNFGWSKKKKKKKKNLATDEEPNRKVERPEQGLCVLPEEGDLIPKAMEKQNRILIKISYA